MGKFILTRDTMLVTAIMNAARKDPRRKETAKFLMDQVFKRMKSKGKGGQS